MLVAGVRGGWRESRNLLVSRSMNRGKGVDTFVFLTGVSLSWKMSCFHVVG